MSIHFPEMEEKILTYWQDNNIFEKSLEKHKPVGSTVSDYRKFVFYDGPPFATGLPHHGHLLASTIKDIIPRYRTMQGKYVPRKWGWDCHGLPIEHEIDKMLGMTAQEAVDKLGVKGYNDKCREIVERYTSEWQKTISRLGRWVDFENHYKTMDPSYMQSVWWVFKQLWDKGLVYPGTKVMPFSTALGTPISNFEAGSNYKEVNDPAVVVLFEEFYDEIDTAPARRTYYAAWTTTPWTLPSNLALCVNASLTYVRVLVESINAYVILAKDCLKNFKVFEEATIVDEFEGDALVGNLYFGLYPFSESFDKQNTAFVVLEDDYVTTNTGTGIVHLAPAFGEDDARVTHEADITPVCPVDDNGRFTDLVPPYQGLYVKDADKVIIKDLKHAGRILDHSTIKHPYPFCPRSDTPLIYKSVPAWYIAVEELKTKLITENKRTIWVPSALRDGRFGNWLENARDWCFSRNRVWGTPIPIWVNDKTGNSICIGSVRELKEKTGLDLPEDFDLHRENIDPLTFDLPDEEGTYHRIPEVFDCWFESGAMPYAQVGHPFNKEINHTSHFPADFIAEGLDQTRGWFYTLMVISVGLRNAAPFKNVIVNGIVLAADGKKMSKRLKNYTDPTELLNKYGADALRLYFVNSGLVRGEDLCFKDKGLLEVTRRFLLPLYNAFTFFDTYASADEWKASSLSFYHGNHLDRWICSRIATLTNEVTKELNNYRLGPALDGIGKFIDDLTNWYIRLNRRRFWGEGMDKDKNEAFGTLFEVLQKILRIMAPFAPFLTEHLYQCLRKYGDTPTLKDVESIHLAEFPTSSFNRTFSTLEEAVALMQETIALGRAQRDSAGIKIKIPLPKLTLIGKYNPLREIKEKLEPYVKAELNVKEIGYDYTENEHVEYYAKPNFPALGKRLGDKMGDFKIMIELLDNEDLTKLRRDKTPILLDGEIFDEKEIIIRRRPKKDSGVTCGDNVAIKLDLTLTETLLLEGLAREIVNRIQKARKAAGLDVSDRITISYFCKDDLKEAWQGHNKYIMDETLASSMSFNPEMDLTTTEPVDIDGNKIYFQLRKFVPAAKVASE